MKAAIVAVGSELLGSARLDTNSLRLTTLLDRHGVELRRKAVIGDSVGELASELRTQAGRVELILVTGGLGPTADDVTREAVAEALGRELVFHPDIVEEIERKFASFGRRMPEVNRRQGYLLAGAEPIANGRGTAPGQIVTAGECTLFLFPGVPIELEGMVVSHLEPWLAARSGAEGVNGLETVTLKVACLPESEVEERILPAYEEFGREAITILAKPGEIRLLASARGPERERRELLARMGSRLAELAGDAVFARDEEGTLEGAVGELLRGAGATLTAAESCTGGLLSQRVTAIPGSSEYFLGGAVTYTNELKTQLVGVPAELLLANGAVSEPVARAMASGVRSTLGSTYGIGITGVAGPGGGSPEKPVGTVYIAVAGPAEGQVEHRKLRLPGSREMVRSQSAQWALDLLRRRLLAERPAPAR